MRKWSYELIIYLIITLWATALMFGIISRSERRALKVLYNKTGGKNWFHQKNWEEAFGTEPTWFGITFDADNTTVTEIVLPGNNLNGELPKDMEAFSSLKVLDLSNNKLSGQIPLWLENFKNLKKLDLSHNDFSGKLPPQIGNLKNLEELILDDNRLEGPIPEELGNLSNLKVLRIGSNRLTGEIPEVMKNLKYLEDNKSNFKWNGLYSVNSDLKEFLKKKQMGGDWEGTQTVPPVNIHVIDVTESTITIGWKPVPYVDDNGEYRVFCRREGQPYENKPTISTANKRIYKVALKGLEKKARYYLKICTWTGSHTMNKNKVESLFSKEVPVATGGIIFSGTVRRDEKDGKGIPGVQLTASNGGGIVETDKDGKYRFALRPAWTGVVTPFKEGFKFDPSFMSIDTPIIEDKRDNDFTMECDTVISGRVTYKRRGVGGVTMTFTDESGNVAAEVTDENGYHRKEVSYGWSGSVTPEKAGHRFNPVEKKYDKVISSLGEQNYEVQFPKISGRVKKLRSKKGYGGIELKFSNIDTVKFPYLKDYAITNEDGYYEKNVPENWIGDITPNARSRKDYILFPSSKSASVNSNGSNNNIMARKKFDFFFVIRGQIIEIAKKVNSGLLTGYFINTAIQFGYEPIRGFYLWSEFDCYFPHKNTDILNKSEIWLKRSFSAGIGLNVIRLLLGHDGEDDAYFEEHIEIGVELLGYKEDTVENKSTANNWLMIGGYGFIFNLSDRWFLALDVESFLRNKSLIKYLKLKLGIGYRF